MRDDIHPHWQTEDDDMIVVHAPVVDPVQQEPKAQDVALPAKRHPAALVGIGLVLVLGVVAFGAQDMFKLNGDVVQPSLASSSATSAGTSTPANANTVVIHIKANGFDPSPAMVKSGQSITWQNDSVIPHILRSDTLLDGKNRAMYTTAIFPGTNVKVDLAPGQSTGSYTYTSTTAQDLKGEVFLQPSTVSAGTPKTNTTLGGTADISLFGDGNTGSKKSAVASTSDASNSDGSALAGLGFSSTIGSPATEPAATTSTTSKSKSSATKSKPAASVAPDPLLSGFTLPKSNDGSTGDAIVPAAENDLIPTNPYTVDSTKSHPFDAFGNRIDGKGTDTLHSGAPLSKPPARIPRAKKQPATGSDVWVVLGLSFLVIAGAMVWKKDSAFVVSKNPYIN